MYTVLYSVSKKNRPWGFVAIFSKRLGILRPNFTGLLCLPIYAGMQICIQLSAILTKLCHIKHDHPVHIMRAKCPPSAETHAGIFWHFPLTVRNFWSKFYTPIKRSYLCYKDKCLFNYLQLWRSYEILSATTQRAFRPMADILSTLWWSRLKLHNFVKVAVNWIKNCIPA